MKRFKRTVEDFVCENCDAQVTGNGFTNHCPSCLWSKHVDINPGDRQAECQGLMEPVGVVQKKGEYVITHRCLKCGMERVNKSARNDSFDALLAIGSGTLP